MPVRFLNAEYGAGKSHLLNVLKYRARLRDAIVSCSSQNLAARITLNDPRAVYRQMVGKFEGTPAENSDVLESVMTRWADQSLPWLEYSQPTFAMLKMLFDQELAPDPQDLHERTKVAMVGFLLARRVGNETVANQMMNSLRGSDIANRELAWAAEDVGWQAHRLRFAPTKYDDRFWFDQLGVIGTLATTVGHPCTVVMLDELESLVLLPNRLSRDRAYRTLNSLFTGDYGLAGTLLVFAYTPGFLDKVRRDFEAYGNDFHGTWLKVVRANSLQPRELSAVDARLLMYRLAYLHGQAETWDAAKAVERNWSSWIASWNNQGRLVRVLVKLCMSHFDTACP